MPTFKDKLLFCATCLLLSLTAGLCCGLFLGGCTTVLKVMRLTTPGL